MAYKLVASNQVAFDVRFTLNDKGADVEYGFRAEATRVPLPDKDSGMTIGDFLAKPADIKMVRWLTDDGKPLCPLVDEETGQPPAPGPQALAALYELVPTSPGVVYAAYILAVGAKAKTGN